MAGVEKHNRPRGRRPSLVSRREFERLVRQACEGLPPAVQARLGNVALIVQEWPTPAQLHEAGVEHPHDLFGLYQGVPLVARHYYDPLPPDRITIFRGPILAAATSREAVAREVRTTVRHEIAHFLGMSEADLERLGYA